MGWVSHYSDDPKDSSVFLQSAVWLGESGEMIAIKGGGILITKESKIEYIEFLDSTVDKTNPKV
jgi:hypothetical protein